MRKAFSRKQAAAAEREMAKLQGRWRQVEHEANGIKNPADEFVDGVTTFSGNCFTVHNLDGSVMLRGTFSLDASVSPKAIDWIDSIGPDAGKVLPASYRLRGDTFIFIAGDEGAPAGARVSAACAILDTAGGKTRHPEASTAQPIKIYWDEKDSRA